jgi:lysophospholipase L1-like esterase
MFAYGTNDTYSTTWVNTYKAIIQDFITQGKSPSKIVIITPPWQPANVVKYASMVPALQTMASQLGVKFANTYQATLDGGGSSLLSDGIHPNDAGMQVMANTIIAAINS